MQNERQLLNSFLSGEYSEETEMLFRQYEDNLYNLCCKLTPNKADADDLYQQTWLRVIQKVSMFSQLSLKNWLYTVCINIYRDNFRKSKRRQNIMANGIGQELYEHTIASATDNVSAENKAIDQMMKKLLVSKINEMPDKHRLPLILYYFEGLDYKESANVLKIPIGTVKSRLNTAKRMLREEMEKGNHV
ncbi:MAG: RNA polymerase sigma factor [Christensenellales bacterium]